MSIECIRNHYRVPAKIGGRITYDSVAGTIIGTHGSYLRVRMNSAPSRTAILHPTWRVVYLDGDE